MASDSSSAPITKKGVIEVAGIHTDIVCTKFSNKFFIVVTQYQKLGTLVHVTQDRALDDPNGIPTYTTKVLFGQDEPVQHVIARNIASHIPSNKPSIISIALKDNSPPAVRQIGEALSRFKVW